MKATTVLLLVFSGLLGVGIWGCSQDPEVKARKQMLRQLDSAFVAHEAAIQQYELALRDLRTQVESLPLLDDTSGAGLSEEERPFYLFARDRFGRVMPDSSGPVATDPPVTMGENANAIHYNQGRWNQGGWEFFSTLVMESVAIAEVLERLETGNWDPVLSDVKATYTTDSHRETWEAAMAAIPFIARQRYVLLIQDRLHVPPRLKPDNDFSSGHTFSRVALYDLEKKAFLTHFYLLAKNSFMVMSLGSGDESSQINELERDLLHELYELLNKDLSYALSNALPYDKPMPWK